MLTYRVVRLPQLVTYIITLCGVWNVLGTFLAASELMSDEDSNLMYRVSRFPIRTWTEQEWNQGMEDPHMQKYNASKLLCRWRMKVGDRCPAHQPLSREAYYQRLKWYGKVTNIHYEMSKEVEMLEWGQMRNLRR